MNREQLIEALAKTLESHVWPQDADSIVSERDTYFRFLAEQISPDVVEAFAAWLANYDGPGHSAHPDVMAREFREEMTA